MSSKAIFLDRDGVINKVVMRDGKPASPRQLAEFEFEPGVETQLERLRAAGFLLCVVTNQPDVARGMLSREALDKMTQQVIAKCRPDAVKICPHDDGARCECRKPKPGMLTELAREHDLSLSDSFLIGDSRKDSLAARAAGCKSILLDRPYNQGEPADWRAPDLNAAVDLILGENNT